MDKKGYMKEYMKQFRKNHKSEASEYNKIYRQSHKDQIKQYRKNHTDELKQKRKKYYQSHKEQAAEYRHTHKEQIAEYRHTHKEQIAEYRKSHKVQTEDYNRQYRKDHKAELAEKKRIYYMAHKAEIAKRKKEYNRTVKGTVKAYIRGRLQTWRHRRINVNTWNDYRKLYYKAKGQCEFCGRPMRMTKYEKRYDDEGKLLQVANLCYNHNTKEIRGMICNQCNHLLGRYERYRMAMIIRAKTAMAKEYSSGEAIKMGNIRNNLKIDMGSE